MTKFHHLYIATKNIYPSYFVLSFLSAKLISNISIGLVEACLVATNYDRAPVPMWVEEMWLLVAKSPPMPKSKSPNSNEKSKVVEI